MRVIEAIRARRAYRSLEHIAITPTVLQDLAESAQLAPSCFNNQPWRYIFVFDSVMLQRMHAALSSGNEWAKKASLLVAVVSKKEYDCIIKDREYYQFDVGLATGFLILRATELGLVAHPIAGYSPPKVRGILAIPDDMDVITLVIIGKQSETLDPILSEKQKEWERTRPPRLPSTSFVSYNRYQKTLG